MKKIFASVISLFLLLSLLTGCNGQPQTNEEPEPESPYLPAISEKQNFSTKHLKEYSSAWDGDTAYLTPSSGWIQWK